jgi:uncharacterized protein YndB with AHSA1/START domain
MSAQLKFQKPSLTLKRRLNAPPAKIYAAWTDPEKIAKWWGPGQSEVLEAKLDVRVGGRFFLLFRFEGEEHGVGGEYREVMPDRRLAFTWAWQTTPERESFVTITLKPDGDGTILTLLHEQFYDETAARNHVRGWKGSLDRLEQMFA